MNETCDYEEELDAVSDEELCEVIFEQYGDKDIKSMLPWRKPEPDVSSRRLTPLMACIIEKRYTLVPLLLDMMDDAEINLRSPYNWTALTLAASDCSEEGMEIVRQLIGAGADVNAKDEAGWGVLTKLTCKISDTGLLDLAIQKGADINEASEPLGITPLMAAAMRKEKRTEYVQFCLAKGAKRSARTIEGTTAYDLAPDEYTKALIRPASKSVREVMKAAAEKWEKFKTLGLPHAEPAYGVLGGGEGREDVSAKTPSELEQAPQDDVTSLMLAAMGPSKTKVERLIQSGEEIDARDKRGFTALNYAIFERRDRNIKVLLDNGADCNVTDDQGICALSYAAMVPFLEGLRMLREKGADPNKPDYLGRTALFYLLEADAMERGQRGEALRLLLEREPKADPSVKDHEGVTPLNLAEAKDDGSAKILSDYAGQDNSRQAGN